MRCRGLWAGIDLSAGRPPARRVCEVLVGRRVLVKDTHGRTLRLAPPLVISEDELRWAVGEIADVLSTDR